MNLKDLENLETNFEIDHIVLGIDEAGRGPVLGPMVYACCFWKKENEELIKKFLKFADSKTLTEARREQIFELMKKYPNALRYEEKTIHPETLCNEQLRRDKVSLNTISTDAACELIQRALDNKVNVKEVYVDTVGPPHKYKELLRDSFKNYEIKFEVTAKADSLFACVSAASIVAKVTRDQTLENWQYEENKFTKVLGSEKNKFSIKFGSGYPGDPTTKKWLQENFDPVFGYPNVVRFSWSTTNNNMKANGVYPIKWENYVEEEDANKKKNTNNHKNNNNRINNFQNNLNMKKEFDWEKVNNCQLTNFEF